MASIKFRVQGCQGAYSTFVPCRPFPITAVVRSSGVSLGHRAVSCLWTCEAPLEFWRNEEQNCKNPRRCFGTQQAAVLSEAKFLVSDAEIPDLGTLQRGGGT